MRAQISTFLLLAVLLATSTALALERDGWTTEETRIIVSLSLSELPPLPADPSNIVGDNPDAAALGKALFFDTRLSSNGQVSCATCHLPDRQFQDDLALSNGVGRTARRAMPIAGTAFSPWLFWDGRRDSQWSQALGPLESAVEHGTDRAYITKMIRTNYADQYKTVFGSFPEAGQAPDHASPNGSQEAVIAWAALDGQQREAINRIFSNVGKAIAAFERTILPVSTRFDAYADALASGADTHALLSEMEMQGLRLFIGRGECTNCHNGPLLTDHYFHNTGVPAAEGLPSDLGRSVAVEQVIADPFNCLGKYSDAGPDDCAELTYIVSEGEELVRAYKPPSLRGVADRPPYMHAGQIKTLADVLDHYNTAPAAPNGYTEISPLSLSEVEIAALEAFLRTLGPDQAGGKSR